MVPLLDLEDLQLRYGSLAAVDGVSLHLPVGGRHALIGPNGAGKTTLLNLIAGALRPDQGRIRFAGRDITRWGPVRRARAGIGRTHQAPAVLRTLTTRENVLVAGWRQRRRTLVGPHWSAGRPDGADRPNFVLDLLDELDLADRADILAGYLSHGQRRLLELAMALAGRPRLLLLDEPAAGLSAPEIDRLTALLTGLAPTIAILLIEHNLDLVSACADTVTVLRAGQVLRSGPPAEVLDQVHGRTTPLTAVS